MNDENQQPPVENPQHQSNSMPAIPINKKRSGVNFLLVLAIAGLLVSLLAVATSVWAMMQYNTAQKQVIDLSERLAKEAKALGDRKLTTGEADIDTTAYQAIFLDEGQVYFGKITAIDESKLTLENIFYLRTGTDKKNMSDIEVDIKNNPQDVSLIKLGEEMHGPQDKMFIERSKLIFWENLKPEGNVSKAITDYNNKR